MDRVVALWRSTVGTKAIMAVTELILFAYLIEHVAGNLLVFGGAASIKPIRHRASGSPGPAPDRTRGPHRGGAVAHALRLAPDLARLGSQTRVIRPPSAGGVHLVVSDHALGRAPRKAGEQ